MRIRKATIKDYEAVYQLIKQLDGFHRRAFPDLIKSTTKKNRSLEWYKKIIDDKKQILILGYEDDSIIGFAQAELVIPEPHPILNKVKQINLHDIVINEKYRGSGCGKRLYLEIEKFAKINKTKEIVLNVWLFNQHAIRFYKRCGFKLFSVKMIKSL